MFVSLFITKRYIILKKPTLTNIIGIISFIAITLSTFSLIIALSVFNGLEDYTKNLIKSMKPDISITSSSRFFSIKNPFIKNITKIQGISKTVYSTEVNAILSHEGNNIVSIVKGVSRNFLIKNKLKNSIVSGRFKLFKKGVYKAIIGRGVQHRLKLNTYGLYNPITVYYPKKFPKSSLGIVKIFNKKSIYPIGVFALERDIDHKYIIVPITFLQKLIKKKGEVTSLDIYLNSEKNMSTILTTIRDIIPQGFKALSIDEQTEGFISGMKLEKNALQIVCLIIIAATLINIFFVLSMLVMRKKKDIAILKVLGANDSHIRWIFFLKGIIIASIGAFLGILLALALIVLQKKIGLISLGVESSVLKYYPVKINFIDIAGSFTSVVFGAALISYLPSQKAANICVNKENLEI